MWVPQAKWMHQIVQINFENYKIFSPSEGAYPPQTPPVPTGAEVLLVLNWGAPLLKNPGYANGMHHFQNYILQKNPLKLVNLFQRYDEQLKDAKDNRKQKTFSALFGSILTSIFQLILLHYITWRGKRGAMDRASDSEYMNDSPAWVRATVVPKFVWCFLCPWARHFTVIVPWFGGHVEPSVPCTCI